MSDTEKFDLMRILHLLQIVCRGSDEIVVHLPEGSYQEILYQVSSSQLLDTEQMFGFISIGKVKIGRYKNYNREQINLYRLTQENNELRDCLQTMKKELIEKIRGEIKTDEQ